MVAVRQGGGGGKDCQKKMTGRRRGGRKTQSYMKFVKFGDRAGSRVEKKRMGEKWVDEGLKTTSNGKKGCRGEKGDQRCAK